MPSVVLNGLPENSKVPKLIFVFKSILKKANIYKFWITEMADVRGTNLKFATVKFYNSEDAHAAVKVFDGFIYRNGSAKFPLSARFEEERPRKRSPSPYEHGPRYYDSSYPERSHDVRRYSRERNRSRSPHYDRESSKLDLEIELLKKQRMIVEEERRLLLERKKLELVKEYGPGAVKDFVYIEDRERDRDRRHRADRETYKSRRPSPSRSRERYTPHRPNYAPPIRKKSPYRDPQFLPNFFAPCKFIISEMKDIMQEHSSKDNGFLLLKLTRSTVRKRLAVLLENKPRLATKDIIVLYRERYPTNTDEFLVKKLMRDVEACDLPTKKPTMKKDKSLSIKDMISSKEKGTVQNEKEITKDNTTSVSIKDMTTFKEKGTVQNEKEITKDNTVIKEENAVKEDKIVKQEKAEIQEKMEQEDQTNNEDNEKVDTETRGKVAVDIKIEGNSEQKDDKESETSISKGENVQTSIDKNVEYALSLDATEIVLALDNEANTNEWPEGDAWNEETQDEGKPA